MAEKNDYGRKTAAVGSSLVDPLIAIDLQPIELDKVKSPRDIEKFLLRIENTVNKDRQCHPDALSSIQFNWTCSNRAEPEICKIDYGIPTSMEEVTSMKDEKRSQLQDNSSDSNYLKWLTGGKFACEKKKWPANAKLHLDETEDQKASSEFFRAGRGDYSSAELYRATAQKVRSLLGMYLLDDDIRERWYSGGWARDWPSLRARLLEQCDFQEKVKEDRRLSVMHKQLKDVLFSPDSYRRNCAKITNIVQPFMINTPQPATTGQQYSIVGNNYNGEEDRAPVDYKETLGPGVMSMISMLACINANSKDIAKCEDKFIEENLSIGPISMHANRYKWHHIVAKCQPSAKSTTKLVASVEEEDEMHGRTRWNWSVQWDKNDSRLRVSTQSDSAIPRNLLTKTSPY